MTNAFTAKPKPLWTPEELRIMRLARAGSRGGTVKNERNDPKSGTYLKPKGATK